MIKVAIFENEFLQLKTAFEAANLLYFEEKLKFEVFEKSQDFGDLKNLIEFKFVIIDVDLSPKSDKDGFQLIKDIIDLSIKELRIIVLTGHMAVDEQLKIRGLPNFPVITKPVSFETIFKALKD